MKQFVLALALVISTAGYASAAGISIFSAPDQFQNGGVNPCIFSGNGQNGCNQAAFPFAPWTESTQQFATNPLVNDITPGTEILQFATDIGRDFILGLDVNQAGTVQTLTNVTITFKGATGNVLGSGYQLGGTPVDIPVTAQGEGYTDYILSAGCGVAVGGGPGVAATCGPGTGHYTAFSAPTGTREIVFTYGMGTFNDGAERLFLIADGPGGSITPFNVDPTAVPEPASMMLLGSGLLFLGNKYRNVRRAA